MPLIQDYGHAMIWLAIGSTNRVLAAKHKQHAIDMFFKKFGAAPDMLLLIPYFLSAETVNDRPPTSTGPQPSNP